jgi:hypothetical protein
MRKYLALAAATAMTLTAGQALAQSSTTQQNPLASIFSVLFGDRAGSTTSIEAQWAAGRTPLADQQYQFESRVDTEVRSGTLTQPTATRLKSD